MIGRLLLHGLCWLLAAVAATTGGVIAVALLATDLDRHVGALAVLPAAVVLAGAAGWGLSATRRDAR